MRCVKCGFQNAEGASFCVSCGAALCSGFSEDTIGPYVLIGELGKGAMARVWRALDPRLEREVAIKEPKYESCLPAPVLEEMGRRFVREGVAAARLSHPNIVTIFEADNYDGRPAIVMELVEGSTLGQLLQTQTFSQGATLDVLRQLLSAVGYAHDKGVVHRDIKPDNIFVSDSGRVKLADFGIARVDDGKATHATITGAILGTPSYMSPEQARGLSVDARSDLFSIGAVAYEMLSGSPPFGTGSTAEVLYRVVHEPVPELRTPNGAPLDSKVRDAVMTALAKDPADRPQSAAEFLAMLDRNAAPIAQTSSTRVSHTVFIYGAVFLAGILALAVILMTATGPTRLVADASTTNTGQGHADAIEDVDTSQASASHESEAQEDDYQAQSETEVSVTAERETTRVDSEEPADEIGELDLSEVVQEPTDEIDGGLVGQFPPEFTSVDASSEQSAEGYSSSSYSPWMARDNDTRTAWIEGVDGPGYGEWIRLTADSPQIVSGIKIVGGFPKDSNVYSANYRPREITIELADGYTIDYTLNDVYDQWQNIAFDKQHVTTYVKITINSVYDTEYWTDTCIAEITVF